MIRFLPFFDFMNESSCEYAKKIRIACLCYGMLLIGKHTEFVRIYFIDRATAALKCFFYGAVCLHTFFSHDVNGVQIHLVWAVLS